MNRFVTFDTLTLFGRRWFFRYQAANGEPVLDVTPRLPQSYVPDRAVGDPVISRDGRIVAAGVVSDRANLIGGKLRTARAFTSRRALQHCRSRFVRRPNTTSQNHVVGVLAVRPPSKVARINAPSVVARMQREHGTRSWPAIYRQRDMGSEDGAQDAVTISVFDGHPLPTFVGTASVDVRPKTKLQFVGYRWQASRSHGEDSFRGGQGRALCNQRFRPVFMAETRPARKWRSAA